MQHPDSHVPVLKKLSHHLAPVLVDTFQLSMKKGMVPDSWREANVTPIFKKEAISSIGNYRPLS
jgi:hypothetical protein